MCSTHTHTHNKFDYSENLKWDTSYSIIHYWREEQKKYMELVNEKHREKKTE